MHAWQHVAQLRQCSNYPEPQIAAACTPPADVPEGKGVSSSAAVEVAAMAAVAAAYSIRLEGRELALLCQRVENAVVGERC